MLSDRRDRLGHLGKPHPGMERVGGLLRDGRLCLTCQIHAPATVRRFSNAVMRSGPAPSAEWPIGHSEERCLGGSNGDCLAWIAPWDVVITGSLATLMPLMLPDWT